MPEIFDRVGTFRGRVMDHAVSETKNGFPQLVAKIEAVEYFDPETEEWGDWSEYEMQITAFLVLFASKGPCLNYDQCQKAFGWGGESFASLNDMDLSGVRFQFRVEDETYDNQTRRKVVWIDASDATPGQTLKKLDAKGLQALDGRYAGQMGGKAKAPAGKPPTAAPKSPAKATAPTPAPEPEADTTAEPPKSEAAPPKAPPKGKGTKKSKPKGSTKMTKALAWKAVNEYKTKEVEDEALNEAWIASCEEVLGEDGDEDTATAEQWTAIQDATLDKIPYVPF